MPELASKAEVLLGIMRAQQGDDEGAEAAWRKVIASEDKTSAMMAAFQLRMLSARRGDRAGMEAANRLGLASGMPNSSAGQRLMVS